MAHSIAATTVLVSLNGAFRYPDHPIRMQLATFKLGMARKREKTQLPALVAMCSLPSLATRQPFYAPCRRATVRFCTFPRIFSIAQRIGLSFLRAPRRRSNWGINIPVVVLTNSKDEADILKSYQLQANCYLSKSVLLEAFGVMVQSFNDLWLTKVKLPTHQKWA
jgi:DNA-binding NarL/FixJ family response regulator